ncbi:hypothetical protein [Nonomuraea salmonea]|uniref:hypothetical protein n=1 Tax=Nonomuraea salmonea TaxID=46181 RepID=UPI0031EBD571
MVMGFMGPASIMFWPSSLSQNLAMSAASSGLASQVQTTYAGVSAAIRSLQLRSSSSDHAGTPMPRSERVSPMMKTCRSRRLMAPYFQGVIVGISHTIRTINNVQ